MGTEGVIKHLDYLGYGGTLTTYIWWTNLLTQVKRFLENEGFSRKDGHSSQLRPAVCSGHKLMSWTKNVLTKFGETGHLIMGHYTRTFMYRKARAMMSKHTQVNERQMIQCPTILQFPQLWSCLKGRLLPIRWRPQWSSKWWQQHVWQQHVCM